MNYLTLFPFLIGSFIAKSQSDAHSGIYSFGESPENAGGILYLYPTHDSTYLFYLELGRGAPSYNSGAMVGEFSLDANSTAHYEITDTSNQCKLSFLFEENSVRISSHEVENGCRFGFGVSADGVYTQTSSEVPTYFHNRIGKKTYFQELDIENWSE
ncbi:MAG: hypothetical protein HWE22_17330 [Flavobacteriales bacterium]|nr:hypothetical protein [Flavobacteriales bacterium]